MSTKEIKKQGTITDKKGNVIAPKPVAPEELKSNKLLEALKSGLKTDL